MKLRAETSIALNAPPLDVRIVERGGAPALELVATHGGRALVVELTDEEARAIGCGLIAGASRLAELAELVAARRVSLVTPGGGA